MGHVKLFQGKEISLEPLSDEELTMVQYLQEKSYADAIRGSAPFSEERSQITKEAYFVIDQFVDERNRRNGGNSYGANSAFASFLKNIIEHQRKSHPENLFFFEAGVGSGLIIEAVSQIAGLRVAGCDAYLNDTLKMSDANLIEKPVYSALNEIKDGSIDIFYWNDVLEHLPTDEIDLLFDRIFQKLSPGGIVITITPYRYTGPHDITYLAAPDEREARGLHLHEYSYVELQRLYHKHHFVPYGNVFLFRNQPYYCLFSAPQFFDKIRSGAELLCSVIPCRRPAHLICRRFRLNVSVVSKPLRGYQL